MLSFLLLLFFFLPFANVHADEVTSFAFTTPAAFAINEYISVSVQSQNVSGEKTNVTQTTCLRFMTSSATGVFSASASAWEPLSALTVTMSRNSANRTVSYVETVNGNYTFSLHAASKPPEETRSCTNWPLAEWPVGLSASQSIVAGTPQSVAATTSIPHAPTPAPSPEVPASPAASGGGGSVVPLEPHIFVEMKAPARAVAGADSIFNATTVGIKREPIPNARFVWSFGDGAIAEGKKVLHAYHLPASYVVLVEASSGEWSATARADITVVTPQITLSRIAEGADGFIEVQNNSTDDLDLSRWFLRSSSAFFSFPNGTILKGGSAVPFASVVTKLTVEEDDTALLYPNGTEVVRYIPSSTAPLIAEEKAEVQENIKIEPREDIKVEPRREVQPLAPTTELVASVAEAKTGGSTFVWAGLAFALATLGAGGYFFAVRHQPAASKAAVYDIVE